MRDIAAIINEPGTSVAVVGANDDPAKYGSVIYRDLKRKGIPVLAVNPNRSSVDGDPAYPTLADLPEAPSIVNLVVPASVGLGVVAQAEELGYRNVWVQPGAESPALIGFLQEHDFNYLAHSCIMVQSRFTHR